MTRSDQMKLGVFLLQAGHNEGAWRDPGVPADGGVDIDHYTHLARTAEDAAFHFVFLNDSPSIRDQDEATIARVGRNDGFEPLTLLSALSARTERIGLVASATTTYHHPYHLARMFASLDHLSRGRAGWNIVTSAHKFEATNFGQERLPDHDERYDRGREFVDVVRGLWDSFEDDAFIRDKASGIFVDTRKLHVLDHHGSHFSVRGPLNIARPPQGHPVLVQAGASEAGMAFAAEFGEVIFTAEPSIENGRRYYESLKQKARAFNRTDDQILIMPGIVPIVGQTREEARQKLMRLQSYTHMDVLIGMADRLLGFVTDLRSVDLDSAVPRSLPQTNFIQSRQKLLLDLAARENLSWRELVGFIAAGHGHLIVVGTPDDVADTMIEFFESRAADGFNVLPAMFPQGLDEFIRLVLPELRRRGKFRSASATGDLRENLGLRRPGNRFDQQSSDPAKEVYHAGRSQ